MFARTLITVRPTTLLSIRPTTTTAFAVRHMSSSKPPAPKANNEHAFNKDGGWAEETASHAEAAVKADRGHHHETTKDTKQDLEKLQRKSAEILAGKHGKKTGGH
ncbi:hypothetical protein HKX48_003040 [Thoreauomyces humboldtii]|nr:hypothetical protein HKX48_003040 [Thoreauomyces humboldtii]